MGTKDARTQNGEQTSRQRLARRIGAISSDDYFFGVLKSCGIPQPFHEIFMDCLRGFLVAAAIKQSDPILKTYRYRNRRGHTNQKMAAYGDKLWQWRDIYLLLMFFIVSRIPRIRFGKRGILQKLVEILCELNESNEGKMLAMNILIPSFLSQDTVRAIEVAFDRARANLLNLGVKNIIVFRNKDEHRIHLTTEGRNFAKEPPPLTIESALSNHHLVEATKPFKIDESRGSPVLILGNLESVVDLMNKSSSHVKVRKVNIKGRIPTGNVLNVPSPKQLYGHLNDEKNG